jgi:hypothetical protein
MTVDVDVDGPLVTLSESFVVDPDLGGGVEASYDITPLHSPTAGPNRYTVHVPTETTRLSLGQSSGRWDTDTGIVGHTESHIHFETKAKDKTVMSLGGPATTSDTKSSMGGKKGVAPVSTQGYSMVTEVDAWHDAKHQHYLISQDGDISLRTGGGGKRAVVQADEGKVDLTGHKQVNIAGGGISIAAGELEVEDVGYGDEWEGERPHSSAAASSQIAMSIVAALSGLVDFIANKTRTKYGEGDFSGAKPEWGDKNKRKINGALLGLAINKVRTLMSAPDSPAKCVKLAAVENVAALAGGDISIFGVKGASLGSALWTTVSAGMAASLKATAFGGVGGAFASMKGYRKVEMGSDWGKIFVGAETEIHMEAAKDVTIAAKGEVAHVAAPDGEALFGGKKAWLGTTAGGGWGLLLDDEGLALGKASGADKLDTAKVEDAPALRIKADSIEVTTKHTSMKIANDLATMEGKNRKIRFEASGPITVNGAKILLK